MHCFVSIIELLSCLNSTMLSFYSYRLFLKVDRIQFKDIKRFVSLITLSKLPHPDKFYLQSKQLSTYSPHGKINYENITVIHTIHLNQSLLFQLKTLYCNIIYDGINTFKIDEYEIHNLLFSVLCLHTFLVYLVYCNCIASVCSTYELKCALGYYCP